MLKTFSVENFRAFSNKVTIDFAAVGNYAFNKECLRNGIVKTAIMYGKNAGGKSSLAYALVDIVSNLTDNNANSLKINSNYLNLVSGKNVAIFEYCFCFRGKDVVYTYKKTNVKAIVYEKLVIDGKTVVEYDRLSNQKEMVLTLAGTESLNRDLSQIQISYLKYIRANAVLEKNIETDLFNDFISFVDKMLLFWSLEDRSFIGYDQQPCTNLTEKIVEDGLFDELKQFFKAAGFTENLIVVPRENNSKVLYIKFDNGKIIPFSLAASTGMNSLLLFYFWIRDLQNIEKSPSFICIDEFDAFYHFELSKFVVEKLKESNVQVLFTTHNTSLLTNDLLRPDCYYICSKDEIVNAHNATEKELREGHNLEKLYRGGTFGK